VIDATRGPAWLGAKVTVISQLAPGANPEAQVLLCLKSPALLPEGTTLLMATEELPVLARVAMCVPLVVPANWELKLRLAGERVSVSGNPRMDTV
jgi:hypothetical protein